ncbi:MAG: Mitochondrial inner membrane protease atp23 [Phylliscum demangeonii]|nr:MAG: Mitochondrial inner membrane protease atp23 [Phylliscum demangeonii]
MDNSNDPPKDPPSSSSSSSSSGPTKANNTGYVPGNDFRTRLRNTIAMNTGQITHEGLLQYKYDRDLFFEKEDCQRCESHRDWLLKWSPTVRFMTDKINQLQGGTLDRDNIRCRRCVSGLIGGGFSPEYGILLCANELRDRDQLEDTLAHEMVHAYDWLRFKWQRENLRHAACTEIRAIMLSGECRFVEEFFGRKNRTLAMQFQKCVRRRAEMAVWHHPRCTDKATGEKSRERAAQVVNRVWDSCFNDTRPFDEVYR